MNEENNNIFNEQQPVNPQQQAINNMSNNVPPVQPPLPPMPPKKSKGPLVIIILLLLAVLGMAGYICYDKFITKDTSKETKNTTEKEETKENTTKKKEKTRNDYFIKLDPSDRSTYFNKVVGKLVINGESKEVKFTETTEEDSPFILTIGDKQVLSQAETEFGLPSFLALLDEEYVVLYFEGESSNKMIMYNLEGKRIDGFGNSLGEIEKSTTTTIDDLIISDTELEYYDCKFNNGPGTETLSKYSVKFENEKYTKEVTSTKQNVTCLSGA